MKADRFIGIVVVVAGFTVALAAAGIDVLPSQPTLSARFFPYLLAGALIVAGAAIAWHPGDKALSEAMGALFASRGVLIAILFAVYATTFRYVDFRLGTWVFMLLAMIVLGSRRPSELVVLPIAVSGLVYTTFRYGFTVLLPVWT